MDMRIEENQHGCGCKVWLGDNAINFVSLDEGKSYLAQLKERIDAAADYFTCAPNEAS